MNASNAARRFLIRSTSPIAAGRERAQDAVADGVEDERDVGEEGSSRRPPSAVAHRSSSRSGPSGIRNASTTTNAIRRGRVSSGQSRMGERLLAAREPEPSLDLRRHKLVPRHASACPTATANSCRTKSMNPVGRLAVGDAPGCCGAIRTRSAAGRLTNRSGGSRTSASPSTPTGTGCDEVISTSGADHC